MGTLLHLEGSHGKFNWALSKTIQRECTGMNMKAEMVEGFQESEIRKVCLEG